MYQIWPRKKTPARKVGTRSRTVWTQCLRQVCLSRCPQILESKAFRDSGKSFQQFSRNFPPELPQRPPETATAFSSFLIEGHIHSGGVKQGRFVILRFPLLCTVWGSQDTEIGFERRGSFGRGVFKKFSGKFIF